MQDNTRSQSDTGRRTIDATSAEHGVSDARPWYQRERWLAVCLAAFVPLILAVYLPASLKVPMAIVAGVMFTISMFMLVRRK